MNANDQGISTIPLGFHPRTPERAQLQKKIKNEIKPRTHNNCKETKIQLEGVCVCTIIVVVRLNKCAP